MKNLDQAEPRIPVSSLTYIITNSGSYYLPSDMLASGGGIIVQADNVTIDPMDYSLIGVG